MSRGSKTRRINQASPARHRGTAGVTPSPLNQKETLMDNFTMFDKFVILCSIQAIFFGMSGLIACAVYLVESVRQG